MKLRVTGGLGATWLWMQDCNCFIHSEQKLKMKVTMSGQSQVATSSIAWVNEKGCRIANPSH